MTLPAAIAEIAARHDIAYSDRRHSIVKAFKNAHNDRGALLRAYREQAEENERLTLERDEARGIKLAQLKAVVGERDRLRASHAKVFEAGWRTAATWAVRADLIFDIGSPAYLEDQAKALADAQRSDPDYQPLDAAGNPAQQPGCCAGVGGVTLAQMAENIKQQPSEKQL